MKWFAANTNIWPCEYLNAISRKNMFKMNVNATMCAAARRGWQRGGFLIPLSHPVG